MSNELVREKIVLEQKIGKETTQVLIEGEIIVPDIKPDVAVILQTDSKATIDKVEVSGERVSFMGRLDIQVLYLAKGMDKPVHSMSVQAAINDFMNIDGVTKDMWVEAEATITNMEYRVLNDRKISYRAVTDVHITGENSDIHEIVTNISDIPENQLLKTNLNLNRSIENKEHQFIVKDEIAVPSGKPNIREILQCNIVVSNKDVKVGSGKVTLTGELVITALYKGDSEDSLIEFIEQEVPFNGVVEMPGTKDDMLCDINIMIQDQYIQVKPDNDGEDRVIDVEVSVGAIIKLHSQASLEILEDAYCINKQLKINKTPIKYPRLVCRNKNQCPVKEVVTLDEHCPDILQIFRVRGIASADEIKVIDDKVIVEGIIDTDVLYVAESDDTPLYSFKTVIPYRQIIETKGATKDMDVSMNITVDHVGFNMLSGREMEARFLISFNTIIIEEKEMHMITDIEFSDMDKAALDNVASMTVYVVQKNDSLWKIAKKYNTCIDELLSINEIENPDHIFPGQKLLILKKI